MFPSISIQIDSTYLAYARHRAFLCLHRVETAAPTSLAAAPATSPRRPAGPTDPDQVVSERALRAAGVQTVDVIDRAAEDPMRGFASPREFLSLVMRAGQTGHVDDRLGPLTVHAAAGADEQRSDQGEHGGFLVPVGLSPTLLQLRPDDDPIAPLVFGVPMGNPVVAFPARVDKDHNTSVSGGLTVSRRAQTAAATSSRMEIDQVTLHARSLFGLAYSTEEMLIDSPISFIAILERGFSDQFGSHKVNERVNGTGSGEPLGILNAPPSTTSRAPTSPASSRLPTRCSRTARSDGMSASR